MSFCPTKRIQLPGKNLELHGKLISFLHHRFFDNLFAFRIIDSNDGIDNFPSEILSMPKICFDLIQQKSGFQLLRGKFSFEVTCDFRKKLMTVVFL